MGKHKVYACDWKFEDYSDSYNCDSSSSYNKCAPFNCCDSSSSCCSSSSSSCSSSSSSDCCSSSSSSDCCSSSSSSCSSSSSSDCCSSSSSDCCSSSSSSCCSSSSSDCCSSSSSDCCSSSSSDCCSSSSSDCCSSSSSSCCSSSSSSCCSSSSSDCCSSSSSSCCSSSSSSCCSSSSSDCCSSSSSSCCSSSSSSCCSSSSSSCCSSSSSSCCSSSSSSCCSSSSSSCCSSSSSSSCSSSSSSSCKSYCGKWKTYSWKPYYICRKDSYGGSSSCYVCGCSSCTSSSSSCSACDSSSSKCCSSSSDVPKACRHSSSSEYGCCRKSSSCSSTSNVTVDCCESSSNSCFDSSNDCTACCSTLSKSKSISISSTSYATMDTCFDKNSCRNKYKVVRVYQPVQNSRPTELDYHTNKRYVEFKDNCNQEQFTYLVTGLGWLASKANEQVDNCFDRAEYAKFSKRHMSAITLEDYKAWKNNKSYKDCNNCLTYLDWYDTMNARVTVKIPKIKGYKKTRSYITYLYLKKKGFGSAYTFKKFLVFYDWFHYAALHDKDYRDTCAFASFCVAYDKCTLKKRYCQWRKTCKNYGDWFVFNLWYCCNRKYAEQFIWKNLVHNRYNCNWECNYYYKLVKKYWPKKYFCKYQQYVAWRQYAFRNNIDPDNYVEYEFWKCNLWDCLPPLPPQPVQPVVNTSNPCNPVCNPQCQYFDIRCITYKNWRCCKTQCDFVFVIDFLCWVEDQKYYYKRAKKLYKQERCCHNGPCNIVPLQINPPTVMNNDA